MSKRRRAQAEEFTIGWICALQIELVAAREALDEEYEHIDAVAQYKLGRIGGHNIVISRLPSGVYGTDAAAAVASGMKVVFPGVRTSLLVGIAGGVPSEKAVIQLGDVIISQPQGRNGGVIRYDSLKATVGGQQDRNGFLHGPPRGLLRAVATLRSDANVGSKIQALLSSFPHQTRFERPTDPDILFDPSFNHVGGDTCDQCLRDRGKITERAPRTDQDICIHYGTIGSGNRIIEDGVSRDSLSKEYGGILCFEMEAAGVMSILPCLVVRGVCDYADSHKNKTWEPFAAAAAAACAKQILLFVPTTRQSFDGQLNEDQQAVGGYSLPRKSDALAHRPANHTPHQRPLESSDPDSNSMYTSSTLSEQQTQRYVDSLMFDQIDTRHATINNAHTRTCSWLLENPEYQDWLAPETFSEHHGMFWIKGRPGSGKSTIYSLDEETSSQSSSERTPLGLLAEIRVAHLLAKDHNISRLCVEALTRMEKLRLRRNLRRLLESYYQSLLSSTSSILERNSVAILRRRRAQEHVAQKLLDIIQPEHEIELQRIEHQVRVHGPRIEGCLEVAKGSVSMYEDLDEQLDKRASQVPVEEDDSASDYSSEGETIINMPNISHLEGFFKAGIPFQRLLVSMQLLLIPSTLLPLARILMTIPNTDIWFADAYTQTYSDTFKQYFETLSDRGWDWWPLSPCQRALSKEQIRIYWRCHCSMVLWHDVEKDAADNSDHFYIYEELTLKIAICV